mmetsp:Transcript_39192/g.47137  ORF Transcript_39192/g.47137 Transcript_39192/m.47137 type:complete len:574 (-) Transcript_39192:96-1817(-)|eukprot:CAMPEP_0194382028 /NCGR_PEP_ID=MMETSP0174-20130528/57555_1 /TAXON_ID=216777 /ORGANISM="Proboscia alata, Strain PI-D3" /LENGTH=573 /DNA_ID=CAMNT_0039166955 /DNA_START=60 /DNA_END=1781 /DNA_ORIENTATION=+
MEQFKIDNTRENDTNVRRVIHLWSAYNFFIAPIRDGLNPFVSVYLVTVAGLSPGIAGLIWFIRDLSLMISQIPFGFLFDYTAKKKHVVFLCTTLCTFVPLAIIWSTNVPILIIKTILEGVASSGLQVSKGPFTLGISGHEMFDVVSKNTEIAEHLGAFFASLGAGFVAYALFPNVELLFYVIAFFGLTACMCILLMPTRSTPDKDGSTFIIVDDDLARNSNNTDVENHDTKSSVKDHGKTTDEEFHNPSPSKQNVVKDERAISTWKTISTDKNILLFAASIFLFHLGNAAILPLLGQAIALNSGRAGIPFTAANIVTAQVSSIVAAYAMDYFVNTGVRINIPILIGFGSQALRIGIILILSYVWPNQYALVATQLLDGLGAGVNGLAILQVTKLLTSGTSKFGVVYSFIHFFGSCGGALSNLLSGFIVEATSYETGFIFLLCPIVVSLILINLLEVQADLKQFAEEVDSNIDITIESDDDDKITSQTRRRVSYLDFAMQSSNMNSYRSSINANSMNMPLNMPAQSPQGKRRSSIQVAEVCRRSSSVYLGVSPEIKFTRPTMGRRLSSVIMKYD